MAIPANPQEQESTFSALNEINDIKTDRTCDNCGKHLTSNKRLGARFCSDKCRYLNWHKNVKK